MKFSFIIKLAYRDIKGYKLRSILTIGGVAIGISFIVFLLSLSFGLERLITSQITDIEALQVLDISSGKSKIVKIDDTAIEKLKSLGTLEIPVPSASMSGKVEYETSMMDAVIYGKDLGYLPFEGTRKISGGIYTSDDAKEAIVNLTTLQQLGIKEQNQAIGKEIKVTFILPNELTGTSEARSIQKTDEYKIVGVIENDGSPYVYVPLKTIKTLGLVNYNNLKVKVKDKDKIDIAKKQIENMGYKVTAIRDTVNEISQFFVIFKFILVGFGLIAMVVASLGMFNTLTISLLEKTREIGLLKVLGSTNKDIHRIFLTQAFSLGFIGGTFGILTGYLSGQIINLFIINLAYKTDNKPVTIFYIPLGLIFLVFVFSLLVSFITGLYPSRRATRISALNALRYE